MYSAFVLEHALGNGLVDNIVPLQERGRKFGVRFFRS